MQTHTRHTVTGKPLQQTLTPPVATRRLADGTLFLDFGKAAFGTLLLPAGRGRRPRKRVVHLGEQRACGERVERAPAGTIRYRRIEQPVAPGPGPTRIVIPPDARNTGPAAVRMPAEIGEVLPFRYAEIENAAGIDPTAVRQIRVHYPFDDDAAAFEAPDRVLRAVWELCKYSIKATTFCGVYVDGDRERIPYEGDAYINQLGHYGVDREYALARTSHEYLVQRPTWPTEWHLHSVLMAWADFLYTGETASLEMFYDDLLAKTLIDFARDDGLISTVPEALTPAMRARLTPYQERGIIREDIRDLVDWPPGSFTDGGIGERDGHEMLPVNTVVNAFHARALILMSRVARVLGRAEDHARLARQARRVRAAIQRRLFDGERGVYIDGEGSRHASLHSNLFPLAFGLVPAAHRTSVLSFVKSRGMACSVYGAQHLLEALYRNGEEDHALGLMTARHDRSWWNMIRVGSTITLEAWDLKYKKNLDWNHAWGAAPANILPRFVLGVRPLKPGFARVLIRPQPGPLARVAGVVPTVRGPVAVSYERGVRGGREVTVTVPPGTRAVVGLRAGTAGASDVTMDGKPRAARLASDGCRYVDRVTDGTHVLRFA